MPSKASLPLAIVLALSACATGGRATGFGGYDESGLASWYGEELAGNRTASGERFDPTGFTAAHRTLPLGSMVEVTNLATGRAVLVRINDRGPGRRDRLIDLSSGAAQRLGTDRSAVSRVRLRVLATGAAREGYVTVPGSTSPAGSAAPLPAGRYLVQVASFSSQARARELAGRLRADVVAAGPLWRVRLGPFDAAGAQRARDAVAARGYGDARLQLAD